MERRYLDTGGDVRPRKDWDYHHIVPQCHAHGRGEKDFINLPGLKLPLFKEYHNLGKSALHSNVQLCPMPSRELRYIIRQTLYENAEDCVYDRFIEAALAVKSLAVYCNNEGLRRDANRISKNWTQQMPYILGGQVRDISEASHEL